MAVVGDGGGSTTERAQELCFLTSFALAVREERSQGGAEARSYSDISPLLFEEPVQIVTGFRP